MQLYVIAVEQPYFTLNICETLALDNCIGNTNVMVNNRSYKWKEQSQESVDQQEYYETLGRSVQQTIEKSLIT